MVSTENKVQIIDIISNHLIEKLEKISYRNIFRRYFCSGRKRCCIHKNRSNKCAQEIDINIMKQRMACVKFEVNCVKVICDNIDAFFLRTVYVFWKGRKLKKLMEVFVVANS